MNDLKLRYNVLLQRFLNGAKYLDGDATEEEKLKNIDAWLKIKAEMEDILKHVEKNENTLEPFEDS